MGPALASTLGEGEFAPTLNLNVNFHAPAKVGAIRGNGRVERRGGQAVATATATALVRKG
nr:PaaI family thioesterase [Pseudomonas sp. OIL-1]